MATATVNYAGAAGVAITLTQNNKANDVWQASTSVDNATTNKYLDALVGGIIQAGTTPTVDTPFEFYCYGQWNDSTEFTGAVTGTDAVYTADGEEGLFRLLTSVIVTATTDQEYEWGPIAVAPLYGGWLPQRWGIVFHNLTVATTNTSGTNNEVVYTGIKLDSA